MPGRDRRTATLYVLVTVVCMLGAALLAIGSASAPASLDIGRLLFWIALTLAASFAPVALPGGVFVYPNTAPLIAAVFDSDLANPFGLVWVAFLGTFSLRDVRRELPWYGTLYNRMEFVIAAFAAWLAMRAIDGGGDPVSVFAQIGATGLVFSFVNTALSVSVAGLRTHTPLLRVWSLSLRNVALGLFAQVPMGWLMAIIAVRAGLWAVLPFAIPLLLARYTFSKFVELRELFFGTVSALSQAIDAKDGYTRGHADRVSRIAGAIARELGLGEGEIERIELAGMLHDVGKIGIEDKILLKPARLDPEETAAMQRHTAYGAAIVGPSRQLRALVPIVLHHHENFDGSGYPDGIAGEAIPLASRIIIVADAYEAMTSDRVYRKAIGHERALEQLRKYQSRQFDPDVVAAFERVLEKRGVEAFEASDLPLIEYETLAEVRQRLAEATKAREDASAD